MNKVILRGHLGVDPELKETKTSGKKVVNFTVATNEYFNNETQTTWHNITTWGKLAEKCARTLEKGASVLIEGKIEYQSWDGKDGQKKYKTVINAGYVENLSAKKSTEEPHYTDDPSLGDIPF